MRSNVVLITGPANEPVTLAEVKSQARIYTTADDSFITTVIIPTARAAIESKTRRAFVSQTWKMTMDSFPPINPDYVEEDLSGIIVLPKPPCLSITSFTYFDTAGVQQTLTAAQANGEMSDLSLYGYQFDPGSETQPGRLTPPWAKPWPPTRRIKNAVQITFVAGYGDLVSSNWTPRAIPIELKQGVLAMASFLYEHRGEEVGKVDIPDFILNLIGPYINEVA